MDDVLAGLKCCFEWVYYPIQLDEKGQLHRIIDRLKVTNKDSRCYGSTQARCAPAPSLYSWCYFVVFT